MLVSMPALSVVFTTDSAISASDTTYDGQDVVIHGCTVTIDGTHTFNSLLIERGESNQPGVLTHGTVISGSPGCNLTISSDATIQGADGSLVASRIDVSERGYAIDQGPGQGASGPVFGAGGGHTGMGGDAGTVLGGQAYASDNFGSSGGRGGVTPGGSGGGLLHLQVSGSLTINGSILANGGSGQLDSGGGSGGCIQLTVGTLTGNGQMSANGGSTQNAGAGGGGGGTVGLIYNRNDFTGSITAYGGTGGANGGAGIISSTSRMDPSAATLIDNGGTRGALTPVKPDGNMNLTVAEGADAYSSSDGTLRSLHIGPGAILTQLAGGSYGVRLVIYEDMIVAAGGSISADGKGYPGEQGPGYGYRISSGSTYFATGAGHAGYGGGAGTKYPGTPYDDCTNPNIPGSGGASGWLPNGSVPGAPGGGLIFVSVGGTAMLNGSISANGADAAYPAGGGSAGSINLTAASIMGSGSMSANGGSAASISGGGSGGMIRLQANSAFSFSGSVTAHGGLGGSNGAAGTIYTIRPQKPNNPQLLIDNGGTRAAQTVFRCPSACDVAISEGAVACTTSSYINSLLVGHGGVLTQTPSTAYVINVRALTDITVDPGGTISANGLGAPSDQGQGKGTHGSYYGGGGGYGGCGGAGSSAAGGMSYGYAQMGSGQFPIGSGGGSGSSANSGGAAGGAIYLSAGQTATINGSVTADGSNGADTGGGGSGGSVTIYATTVAGAGTISVNGGSATNPYAGGGGGGRIYVRASDLFSGRRSACGGLGYENGGAGTILSRPSTSDALTIAVDNAGRSGARTPLDGSSISNTSDLTITGNALVALAKPYVAGTIRLTNGGKIGGYYSAKPGSSIDLTVFGDTSIDSGCAISADSAGYGSDAGPGLGGLGSVHGGGGGYGGVGGASSSGASGGITYGQADMPTMPGSGGGSGGSYPGGAGGSAIKLTVKGLLSLNGSISANGADGINTGGGGSGGSIWLTCNSLAGAGTISANGGRALSSNAGGGGGGRIDLWYINMAGFGRSNVTANGGAGYNSGGAGTIKFTEIAVPTVGKAADHYAITGLTYRGPVPVVTNGAPAVTWSLINGPTDMTIDSATGAVFWHNPVKAAAPYTIAVQATNSAGAATTAWRLTVIDNPKLAPDGAIVRTGGLTISAAFGESFYAQPDGRTWGLRIDQPQSSHAAGAQISIAGSMATDSGTAERCLQASSVDEFSSSTVAALAMPLACVGGADWHCSPDGIGQHGVDGGAGLNNIGLLVRVWGSIKEIDPSSPAAWFILDDGSGHATKCLVPSGVEIDPTWRFVTVTGISSCETVDRKICRTIRVRDQADIMPVQNLQ